MFRKDEENYCIKHPDIKLKMKFRVRIYYDSKVVVGKIIPDDDTIEYLGRKNITNILKNGKIEFVEAET